MFVDGYDEATKTVYEFQGCFFITVVLNVSQTTDTENTIFIQIAPSLKSMKPPLKRHRNYVNTVIEKWEHDFEVDKKANPTLIEFLKTFDLVDPLNPRDSFFGGRTSGVRFHYAAAEGDEIHYVDINSLYPFANKTKTYPVGHPKILVNPVDQDINNYFGIAQVKILPPPLLYHPVLPGHIGGKLTFPLCRKCAMEELEKPWLTRTAACHHTEEERCIIGTWCTPELHKAVELGYRIVKIYEVWNFPTDQGKEGLFADYVNKWLKK